MKSDYKYFDEADSGNVPENHNRIEKSGWRSEMVAELGVGSGFLAA